VDMCAPVLDHSRENGNRVRGDIVGVTGRRDAVLGAAPQRIVAAFSQNPGALIGATGRLDLDCECLRRSAQ
jgi:hypothetical protein